MNLYPTLVDKEPPVNGPGDAQAHLQVIPTGVGNAPDGLTNDQKKEIDQAREEINRDEGISSEEVDKEIDEWLIGSLATIAKRKRQEILED